MQAGTRFAYPGGMEGWVDLVDLIAPRPGVEPATFRSRVQSSTTKTRLWLRHLTGRQVCAFNDPETSSLPLCLKSATILNDFYTVNHKKRRLHETLYTYPYLFHTLIDFKKFFHWHTFCEYFNKAEESCCNKTPSLHNHNVHCSVPQSVADGICRRVKIKLHHRGQLFLSESFFCLWLGACKCVIVYFIFMFAFYDYYCITALLFITFYMYFICCLCVINWWTGLNRHSWNQNKSTLLLWSCDVDQLLSQKMMSAVSTSLRQREIVRSKPSVVVRQWSSLRTRLANRM